MDLTYAAPILSSLSHLPVYTILIFFLLFSHSVFRRSSISLLPFSLSPTPISCLHVSLSATDALTRPTCHHPSLLFSLSVSTISFYSSPSVFHHRFYSSPPVFHFRHRRSLQLRRVLLSRRGGRHVQTKGDVRTPGTQTESKRSIADLSRQSAALIDTDSRKIEESGWR